MKPLKTRNSLAVLVFTLIISMPGFSQEALWHNCSNLYEPQILFANPAGFLLQENRLTIFTSQFLFTGVSDGNRNNYYFGHTQ